MAGFSRARDPCYEPRVSRPARALAALGLALGALASAPSPAAAYEDQATLFVDLGYASALGNDALSPHGVIGGVGGSWGINDAWTLRGRLAWAGHPRDLQVGIVGVEVFYMLDILKLVPFAGLGVDGVGALSDDGTGTTFRPTFAVHAVVGLDWLIDRRFILGLDIRPHLLPLGFDDDALPPFYLSASLRLSIVFDRY